MTDKVKIKKLIEIVGELLKTQGNEWMIDEILQTIGQSTPIEEIAKHSVIQNIHEYCIEQKIEKQANDFYGNFPIKEIIPQLIQDYKRMEHERRRDQFEDFCLCLFQQLENITNFLFEKKVMQIWNTAKNELAIKSYYDDRQKMYVYPENGGKTIEKLIFQNTQPIEDLSKWFANRKFRSVLYFYYFNKDVIKDDFEFNKLNNNWDEIYQMRNENHRGSTSSEYSKRVVERIKKSEGKHYFKFYGFLQDFITQIESSYSTKSEKKAVQKNVSINKSANTLGDNPELAKLFEQLKKSD